MKEFVSRPQKISAVQFTGNPDEIPGAVQAPDGSVYVNTRTEKIRLTLGDYVIAGPDIKVMSRGEFNSKYDPVVKPKAEPKTEAKPAPAKKKVAKKVAKKKVAKKKVAKK